MLKGLEGRAAVSIVQNEHAMDTAGKRTLNPGFLDKSNFVSQLKRRGPETLSRQSMPGVPSFSTLGAFGEGN
jgi:hypothetical protein